MELKKMSMFLVALLVVGIVGMGCQPQSISPADQALSVTGAAAVACPSTGKTDGRLKYQDLLAATTTFDASPTAYWTSDIVSDVTDSGFSASDWSTAQDLRCGNRYTPIAVTTIDDMSSVAGSSVIASGSEVTQVLKGHSIKQLQLKVKDLDSDVYTNVTSTTASSNTAFVQMDSAAGTINATDMTGYTSFTVGADGYLNLRFDVKTNQTKARYGENDGFTYLCVNANSDKWDEPLVSLGTEGNALPDVWDTLNKNDQDALNGYEYCYDVGQIKDTTKSISYYQETASGVNPTATDSPVLRFIAEGRYLSNEQVDGNGDQKIVKGAFTDASTPVEVLTANDQAIKLIIS